MSRPAHTLELLSPARDANIAREAILHGADAVYIGGPSFGARHNAGNSIADIAELVRFAHLYHARVFVTLNTILHDHELDAAQRLIHQLHETGIDALIVQDMGILELDIPPLELHASTQCDIRTPEKAHFLAEAGFSQLVVARELNLSQVRAICAQTNATIEYFIHGALCVAYSGQCYLSHAQTGRSANRGDCSQACRLPYTLKDEQGQVIAHDKHLLSLKDNDQTNNLTALIDAGVRSFKIEGRYKDMAYVKNITAHYRQELDRILQERPELARASRGRTEHFFTPNPDKTFNRGRTDYFTTQRTNEMGAFDSPKFTGLPIGEVVKVNKQDLLVRTSEPLTNGDGLNLLHQRNLVGFRASVVELVQSPEKPEQTHWLYRVAPQEIPAELKQLRLPHPLNRNLDHNWQQALLKTSAERRIALDWEAVLQPAQISLAAISEEGIRCSATLSGPFGLAKKPEQALTQLQDILSQLGNTAYYARRVQIQAEQAFFIPNSQLKALRRDLIETLTQARLAAHPKSQRKPVKKAPVYPESHLSYLANVYNQKARAFYQRHGVQLIEAAYEAHQEAQAVPLMITKHCLRFSFNLCPKQQHNIGLKIRPTPMHLIHQGERLTLRFDCKACEMQVIGQIKKSVLHTALLGSEHATTEATPDGLYHNAGAVSGLPL